ncbi:hypothetical protein [Chitinophaga agrisoli]|nr:hypothetical protein [Chitinophaga agrisoli]
MYYNFLLMYHLGFTATEIREMSDELWTKSIAILIDIREQQAKTRPFTM